MIHYDPKRDGKEAKDLFDKVYKHIRFDRSLAKQLKIFRLGWLQKGPEYSEFLGANTLGTHAIRFSSRDDSLLLTDIYNVDQGVLLTNIKKLPDINPSWQVSTNPVLQTLCYTMHRYIADGKLKGRALEDALKECYYIFSYKVFGSLLYRYFDRPATPALAKATYEALSNRFLIKRLGSWGAVMEYRARAVIPEDGVQVPRLRSYTTDDSVRCVNDLQGAIRRTLVEMYSVMVNVQGSDGGISATSMVEQIGDSEESTRDITDRPDKYVHRLREIVGAETKLVNDDIIHLVTKLVKSSDAKGLLVTLKLMTSTLKPNDRNYKLIDDIVIKTINYVNTKGMRNNYRDNVLNIATHMRGYWSSGSVKDPEVTAVKKYIAELVKTATGRRTAWVVAANTTAIIVYLFVMAVK